ncbi:MAG TPA: arsenate reductase (glutaredoxin) [Flavobacterium sp.]|nr:arsenate reductase (glutaredoxin) [Flavobacterium sp.]HPJ09950.1 arsenate reductase (glutaredoxin) [Flavobacterium sp.]
MIQILHNARCSKSRECLAFLDESKNEYEVIEYLKTPPTVEQLKEIIAKLGIKPIELIRRKEPLWIEKFEGKKHTPASLLKIMAKHPILIERPIVVNGDRAIIARPPEKAADII